MAIYHFSVLRVISRAAGGASACRGGRLSLRLRGCTTSASTVDHDFSNKAGVVHSEVLLPDGAPEHYRRPRKAVE